ncbi:MAG: enoyl-CoA hydratase/isomerase family protein [Dehalococcoidia bacterium]|nr:enoyl-CoA hydratase/isomerase family protein [Dehalococcoidia bacterium]
MYQTILVEKKNHIATITFNRTEKLNAVNLQMRKDVCDALDELESDNDVRVVIMTGAGRAFSVGLDMADVNPGTMKDFSRIEDVERLLYFDKPVIAAINGYALGDGFQYALMCDIVVASEKVAMGPIGARVGALCHIATWSLASVVGRNKASELLFGCDKIDAREAYRIGLVNKVVPPEQLISTAREMAENIIKSAPLSIKHTKRILRQGLLNDGVKNCLQEGLEATASSDDLKEAFKAFAEKREPIFKGK